MTASTEVVPGNWAEGVDPGSLADPREAALFVIERTLDRREPADRLRRRVEGRLEPRDRALLHQLVTGVLRWLLRLDYAVAAVGGRPVAAIDEELLGPLRLGAYQLLFLDRVPAHAAVDTSVELAKRRHRRGAGFVNAVLRRLAEAGGPDDLPVKLEDELDRIAVETSHPRFLVERWLRAFGRERTLELLAANNRDRKPSLLATRGAGSRDGLIRQLADEGVEVSLSSLSPVGLLVDAGRPLATSAFDRGQLYPQDEASQCAALIPLPTAGERVLDAAASPGGKTLTLLAWEPDQQVVSADRSIARLETLAANRRSSRRPFSVVASDANLPAFGIRFDRVVADLSCTGTGTIRKHPELKWRVDAKEVARLAESAAGVLDGLAPLVASGGLLVVATCSIEPEENEIQVEGFLARHPEFEAVDLRGTVPETVAHGLETPFRWRLLPDEEHDGFTVHSVRAGAR